MPIKSDDDETFQKEVEQIASQNGPDSKAERATLLDEAKKGLLL
jgi:uncharacterized membrane protein